nr:MAG TPA: NADH-ubiquinone oxidoreductase-like protein [Caudoviricetes sp.]
MIGIFIPWFNFFTIFLAFIRDNNIYSRLNKEIEDKILETQLLCD